MDVNGITKSYPLFVTDFLFFESGFFHDLLRRSGISKFSQDKYRTVSAKDKLPYYDAIFVRETKAVSPTDPKLEEVIDGEVSQGVITRYENWKKMFP